MAKLTCPVCSATVDSKATEDHISESHSDPDARHQGRPVPDFLREYFSDKETDPEIADDAEVTDVQSSGPLEELGVKIADLGTVEVTTETGAALTASEAKRVMTAVETFMGYRINRAAFLANFVDWGIRNSFTEELADSGGFQIPSHVTVATREEYVKVSTLHQEINNYFGTAGTGRSFTFRRFGRYLARAIPAIVDGNKQLSKYLAEGSPMSNRLGVPPENFLAVTSIFEYIKPFRKWSSAEKAAFMAHNRSVVKMANTQNTEFLPIDLRPSPSQASTMVDNNTNDFGVRHSVVPSDYGKGRNIFEKMWNDSSRPRTGPNGLGY